jgi:cleavage and polyadenylation specificity factor subunit 2
MTSYLKFTPLSGARNEQGLCYLLEIDDAKILLDCGWLETFDTADLELLKRQVTDESPGDVCLQCQ